MIDIVGTQTCQDGLPDVYDGELGLWKKTIEFYFSLEDIFLLRTSLYCNLNIIMLSVLIITFHPYNNLVVDYSSILQMKKLRIVYIILWT